MTKPCPTNNPDQITPAAIAAGVEALNACVSDYPRILPDDAAGSVGRADEVIE
jgi:hypothetical protein